MRIFFWAADAGGCAHYRCHVPAAALAQRGHEVLSQTLMPSGWDSADVIVGQRVCNPGPSQRWQQLAKQGRSRLVYEIDDDLFTTDQTNATVHEFFSRPEVRANIRRNLEVADVVTVSTEPLAEAMRAHNRNVVVVPNFIPGWVLDLPRPGAEGPVTVGWAGGPTHAADWAEAASAVAQFINRNTSTRAHVMGWCPPELWRRLPPGRREFTDWIPSVDDLYRAIDFHIALAPLRATVFNRSKSAIKALEAAALGVPCVASDVGPYPGFVRHGETGFLVSRPHEWPRCLRELLDPTVRAEMGAKARALAAEWTIERNVELWERTLWP